MDFCFGTSQEKICVQWHRRWYVIFKTESFGIRAVSINVGAPTISPDDLSGLALGSMPPMPRH